MARIFITGSSDGLGLLAGQYLAEQGHTVVLHARSQRRAEETRQKLPAAQDILIGDLSSVQQTRDLASTANQSGPFDAVIHNAAIGYSEPRRIATEDGLAHLFAINSLAPYILTSVMQRPARLIYLSSGLNTQGDPSLQDMNWQERPWNAYQAYCDSKLHNILLAYAVARRWPGVLSNALTPGWVPTKMGGKNATDDLQQGFLTQSWLATSDDATAAVSGRYFYHLREDPRVQPEARREELQDRFIAECEELSDVRLPG